MDNPAAEKCPLCGGDNSCAVAAGKPPESCWCQAVPISPDVLAALPEAERGVRCICPACAGSTEGGSVER